MKGEWKAGCLRKEKSSWMAGAKRWRKKKKRMKEEGKQSKGKIATRRKNKEIESLTLEF